MLDPSPFNVEGPCPGRHDLITNRGFLRRLAEAQDGFPGGLECSSESFEGVCHLQDMRDQSGVLLFQILRPLPKLLRYVGGLWEALAVKPLKAGRAEEAGDRVSVVEPGRAKANAHDV